MSLYNMLFGYNPMTGILLQALELTPSAIPRFRDCYLDDTDGAKRIAIFTRTGGGNRDYYESLESCKRNYPEYWAEDADTFPIGPWNEDMRKVVGYIEDKDDSTDSTYATFYYAIPKPFASLIDTLQSLTPNATVAPMEKFTVLIDMLQRGEQNPETTRALDIAKKIFDEITNSQKK